MYFLSRYFVAVLQSEQISKKQLVEGLTKNFSTNSRYLIVKREKLLIGFDSLSEETIFPMNNFFHLATIVKNSYR